MKILILGTEVDVTPDWAFRVLFSESPNPMCLINNNTIVDVNFAFIEKCGFEIAEKSTLIKSSTLSNLTKLEDDDYCYDFSSRTAKDRKIGGNVISSETIPNTDIRFGFIDVRWIDGIDEFSQTIDKLNELLLVLQV